jgi:hypothetical protein
MIIAKWSEEAFARKKRCVLSEDWSRGQGRTSHGEEVRDGAAGLSGGQADLAVLMRSMLDK